MSWPKSSILTSMILTFLVVTFPSVSATKPMWEAPGCHLVGHTRTVSILGCVPFEVTTNACRGFCVSYAVPSSPETVNPNHNFIITSKAQCCGIVDTHEIDEADLCNSACRGDKLVSGPEGSMYVTLGNRLSPVSELQ